MSLQNIPVERLERRRLLSAGDLDPTFGHGGFGSVSLGDVTVQKMLAQPDGKILVRGYTARFNGEQDLLVPTLVRLNPDGSRDKSFGGGDGKITLLRGRM